MDRAVLAPMQHVQILHNRACAHSQVLAIGSEDYKVKCYDAALGEALVELQGHEDAVQAVVFDPSGQFLVSCGSDHTFRMWS